MEAHFNFNDFYKQLTDDEKQICDLCRDWDFYKCEKCEFISRYVSKENEQEVVNVTEEYNKNTKKEW